MSEIKEFLSKNFHQPVPNKRFWTSYKDVHSDDEWIHLTREFANRTACQVEINFGELENSTPNLVINLFTVVDMEWMQVFWGDIKDLDGLKFIFDCIGIPYND